MGRLILGLIRHDAIGQGPRLLLFYFCARPKPLELQQTLHKEGIDEGKVVVQLQISRYLALAPAVTTDAYRSTNFNVMCDLFS